MKDIEQLLQRFMDGATSEQEEQWLANYFSTAQDVPAEWREYAAMFRAFDLGEPAFTPEEIEAVTREPGRWRWLWAVAAACVAAVVVWVMPAAPGDGAAIIKTGLPEDEVAILLAPKADDTLRWELDREIDGELEQSGCKAGDFLCAFNSHSQLIEDNHDPLYVNNVLGRLLALCNDRGQGLIDAASRQMCIDTLEMLSVQLLADERNANNLGVGLCLQCIRALGGKTKST